MDLLKDLRMSLLNFSFVTIFIIHKTLALLKNYLTYFKDLLFECFLRSIMDFYLENTKFFSQHITMENPRSVEENIIKDTGNLFRLKRELNYAAIKDIRNIFRLEKETKAIEYRILRDIKDLSEHKEEENYYKPVRVSNFWCNNYIEYQSNGDGNKTLSVEI